MNIKKEIEQLLGFSDFPASDSLSSNLLKNRKIICYGGGSGYITFSKFVLEPLNLQAALIIDKHQKEEYLFGVPVISPLNYIPTHEELESSVVITVGKTQYHEEIFSYLSRTGFNTILYATDIYEYHLQNKPRELDVFGYEFFLRNKERILQASSLFDDNESRKIYVDILKTHIMRTPVNLLFDPTMVQYFDENIKMSKGYSNFINCGSYDGDTIRVLNSLHGKIKKLVCFEPDANNFGELTKYLSEFSQKIAEEIVAFPCGVFSEEAQILFETGVKNHSSISQNGSLMVQVVSIDNVLFNFEPTFINMDVEGAELQALQGAKNTIRIYKPDLAICVYHSPNDIWNIPMFLDELDVGYKFYLKNYTGFVGDTVLYAIVE